MNSDDLVVACRRTANIGDATAFTDYTDAIVLNELNDKLQTAFEDIVVKARAGYWLHDFNYTTIANDARYRIPPRAVVGGLEKVEITNQSGSTVLYKLDEIPASIAQDYRVSTVGSPYVFTVQSDIVELIPTSSAGQTLRMAYYIRPSRLVTQQSSTQNGGTVRGLISNVNTGTRVLTVNVIPFDMSLAAPAAITSGLQSIDIVHPDGWHELSLVGATQTFSGLNITVGGSDSLLDVQVGDYVRVADQTDWPCLPDDFHRCLADTTAVKILIEQGLADKAALVAENNGNDLLRFKSLLQPRVKAEPKIIGIMRRSRGYGPSFGAFLELEKDAHQMVVRPLGLMTTPNLYGQFPAGAMELATNVLFRAPGLMAQAPAADLSVTLGVGNTDGVYKIMPLNLGHVYTWCRDVGSNVWTVQEGVLGTNSVTLPSVGLTTGRFSALGYIFPVRVRERMLVNAADGCMVGDFMAPSNSTERALRMAGMPQPQFLSVFLNGNPGGTAAIPSNVMVAYACILTRTFADGYVVRSVPSPICKILNGTGASQNIQVTMGWANNAGVLAGDVLEVYRTDGLPSATALSDPGTTLKLIQAFTLSAGDITAGNKGFLDTTIMTSPFYTTTGRALYTNPGQEGTTGANRQPNVCLAQGVYKGFTFFGNLTERPQWTFNVPGGIGTTFIAAQNTASFRTFGIGRRLGSGTITNGSNTITAISAAEIVGLKIGMFWDSTSPPFPTTATITAVGATTVTMSVNATGAGTTFAFVDRIQIVTNAGTADIHVGNVEQVFSGLASAFGFGNGANFEVTANQSYLGDVLTVGDTAPTLIVTVEPIRPNFGSSFTVRATNGANYSPPVPEFTATAQTFSAVTTPNLMQWSKDSEPEHVPASNEDNVGGAAMISMVATKDELWLNCTDGIFRLSGDVPPWRVDAVAPGCVICAPQCMTAMRDQAFAATNRGFVLVSATGVTPISDTVLKETLFAPSFRATPFHLLCNNDADSEVLIVNASGTSPVTGFYVFNATTGAFSFISDTGPTIPTAIAFQSSTSITPAPPGVVLVGASNFGIAQPTFWNWRAPPFSGNYLAPSVRFRPVYGDDPAINKQWVSLTFWFDPGDVGKVVSATISAQTGGVVTLVRRVADAVGTVGINRNFAIDAACRPGFSLPTSVSSQAKFRGLLLRYVPLTAQRERR